jgi:hypothetical protein
MSTTQGPHALPGSKDVGTLLGQLLGRTVKVEWSPSAVPLKAPCVVGVYITDEGATAALCVFDMALACHLGAALSLIPAAVANEAVRKGVLVDNLADNLHEVANVMASLFNHDGATHIKLREVITAPKVIPPMLPAAMGRATARLDLNIAVQGYGAGTLVLARTP